MILLIIELRAKHYIINIKTQYLVHVIRHRSLPRVRRLAIDTATSGLGSIMSTSDTINTSAPSVASSIAGSQLISATGEDESTAATATGKFQPRYNNFNIILLYSIVSNFMV